MLKYIKFDLFLKSSFLESEYDLKWGVDRKKLEKLPDDKKSPVLDESSAERLELSSEHLQTITNKEFLRVDFERRLQYITSPKASFEKVANWEQKEVSFTFTFDWKFNRQFWLKTTAWQVLPQNVKTLQTQDWNIWNRSWIAWEFFDKRWNRLIIWEGTKVTIWNILSKEEIQKQTQDFNEKSLEYKSTWNEDLALESLKRWLDPKIWILLFQDKIKDLTWIDRKVEIEDLLTEFERVKDYYVDDFYKEAQNWNWLTKEFLAYFLNFSWYSLESKEKIFTELWFDKSILEKFKRKQLKWYTWETLSEDEKRKILENISKVPQEFTTESFWVQFVPWSKKCKELFMYACSVSWLPVEWADSEALHRLLQKESAWRVWVMNYEFKKSVAWEILDFKDYVLENSDLTSWAISKRLWTVSNATGLWQMLISNVDKYYPEWREWIWKPLNEAVWMLKYIKDRYWSPENALDFHNKNNWY